MPAKELVPVVYHFFPHYRTGINKELIQSKVYRFLFVGTAGTTANGIEPWSIPPEAEFLKTTNCYPIGRTLFQKEVIRLALRRDFRTIIFFGCMEFASTWIAAAVARITGKRVLFWSHGWICPDKGIKRFARLAFYKLAHAMLLYGHHAKAIGIKEGLTAEKLHVIYNSLDYSKQKLIRNKMDGESVRSMRTSLFRKPELPVLAYVGRLTGERRFSLLIEAMIKMKESGFEVNLLIIGEGAARSSLLENGLKHGLNMHCYGACYDEEVLARLLMGADVTVVPGRVGLTAIHSLTYGTPVIIHDDPNDQHPEWEAILPGYNGAFFANNNSDDLAFAIRKWLYSSPSRDVLRVRCFEVIERFYNPWNQAKLIERALDGLPADDSEWKAFHAAHEQSVP